MITTRPRRETLVFLAAALVAAGCFAAPAEAGTFTIQPDATAGEDAFVDSRSTNAASNYGSSNALDVGHTDSSQSNVEHVLLRFDLAGAPAANVVSADLWLYQQGDGVGTAMSVPVRQVTSAWSENTVT